MSNSLAIAATTAALSNLLGQVRVQLADDPDNALSDTDVTTLCPDKAGQEDNRNQLNLYLYQTVPNAALRNIDLRDALRIRDVSAVGKPADSGPPPLALTLHYLVTAYGRSGDEMMSQRLLGRTMALLHTNPVLTPAALATLAGSTLSQQVERIRITPLLITTEEMSRLWTMFQTKYRISAAYQVSVVLMDSGLPVRTATLGPRVVMAVGPGIPAAAAPPPATAPSST